MKYKFIFLFSLSLISLLVVSCGSFSYNYPKDDFNFMVISDEHVSEDTTINFHLTHLINNINKNKYPNLKFLISTGDNVDHVYNHYYSDSLNKSVNYLEKFSNIIKSVNIPYYLVMGNHDFEIDSDRGSNAHFTNPEIKKMEKLFTKITGFKPYYSFVENNWQFIILNSMSGRYHDRFFDDIQIKFLSEKLKNNLPTILFFHYPLKTDHFRFWCWPSAMISKGEEPEFYNLLDKNKKLIKAIFVGHGHSWQHDKLDKIIDVYETESFGYSNGLPFYVVGINKVTQKVSVARTPLKK